MVRNILFVMADQLRRDYLSCYGARHIATPAIDALAARGVRFANAYVQGPVCGVSRMSYYTGRYMTTHGTNWNFVPLPLHNPTMGGLLSGQGLRTAVVGKTHVAADHDGLRRVGADPASPAARLAAEGGFEPWERDDGLWPGPRVPSGNRYAATLRAAGFGGDNPWHDWANSARDDAGRVLSGWQMRWAHLPAAVPEELSETAYTTDRAMAFIDECGEQPWCLHLSYIKPHWPYVAPAPYHRMFAPEDMPAAVRGSLERERPHPVMRGFQSQPASLAFADESQRRHVAATYAGLVRQVDDHLGRLWTFLETRGRWKDTLVVFCSDHGDYLGDHWLGEKELFHDTAVAVPMIVAHPDAGERAGTIEPRLVEAIDLLPTFIESVGGTPPSHLLEGHSMLPMLVSTQRTGAGTDNEPDALAAAAPGHAPAARDYVVSEGDYAFRDFVRLPLGRPVEGCRMWMVRSQRWKYVHFDGLPAQLFDLSEDPDELVDRGDDPACAGVRAEHAALLFDWLRARRIHPTVTDAAIAAWTGNEEKAGILIGHW